MDKIVFKISKNLLSTSIINKDTPKEDLNNTNIIDTKELVFSKDYIIENLELVSSFLNVIIIKRKVTRLSIKNYEIIKIILDIINYIPSIEELYLRPELPINYDIFLKLLDNKYLKRIDVYDIPKYLLERLDINKNLEIHIRSEILFVSSFMSSNCLNTYSDIYYKKYIIIDQNFDTKSYSDFNTFIHINKYLKTIDFIYFDEEYFKYVIDKLIKNSIHNIKITFNEETIPNLDDIYKIIPKYKKQYEHKLKELNINFEVKYSKEYKKKNLFKQLNLNFIKVSLFSIILVVATMLGINIYRNYTDNQKYVAIENELEEIMNLADGSSNSDDNEEDVEYIEPEGDDLTTTTTTSIYDISYDQVFDKLLAINDDTVGWLTVNNTKINYPVVQSSNNDYYLKHDYYKSYNSRGWVFMDYRDNATTLKKNTIIYAHNLSNGKMFGSLKYALDSDWYTKTSNQIITFNTITTNMNWQIISIYKIPVTSDYMQVNFANDQEYMDWLDMVVNRSIYDFHQDYSVDDNILTLSTCNSGHDYRLIIHAKLIKES